MEKNIIKVGDSLYLKMDSMEQLSAIVKFLDDAKLKKAANELRESMKKDEAPKYNHFNSLSPEDVEETLFDHEARLSRLEDEIAKLEKAVMDIPKTMGKLAATMMDANMGDKDNELKSFSVNLYWNYDDGEDEEDDD